MSTKKSMGRISRIHGTAARRLSAAARLLFNDYSAVNVIAQISGFDNAGDKLFLLRQWTLRNRSEPDAGEVISYGLDLMLKTTAYVPNAHDVRELLTPLPYLQDYEMVAKLIQE